MVKKKTRKNMTNGGSISWLRCDGDGLDLNETIAIKWHHQLQLGMDINWEPIKDTGHTRKLLIGRE